MQLQLLQKCITIKKLFISSKKLNMTIWWGFNCNSSENKVNEKHLRSASRKAINHSYNDDKSIAFFDKS